jgi:hypothetical protein
MIYRLLIEDYKIKSVEVVKDTKIELHKVTKILGSPYDRKEGIQTYKDRKTGANLSTL